MAELRPPDNQDLVLYLKQIAANIESIGKACQDICKAQHQTVLAAQRLLNPPTPAEETRSQGAPRTP